MYSEESKELKMIITDYFDGIFYGDIEKLKAVFHPDALLAGDVKKESYFKKVDEYLDVVKLRQSPNEMGGKNKMKIISLEILNTIAFAKLHVPMFDYNYYDYITFCKFDGKWVIVNKAFTHVD